MFNEGLQVISEGAFHGCSAMTSIRLPSTITEIGERAFYGRSSLREVVLSEGLQDIGKGAFGPLDTIVRGQPEPEKVIQSKVYSVNPRVRRLITLEKGTCLTMEDMVRRVKNKMHSGTQWGEVQSYKLEKSNAVEMAKRTERRNEKIDR